LLNFFLRGHACGALSDGDVSATGLTRDELAMRNFSAIFSKRRLVPV
jgi:hypothetical protein